MFDALCKVGEFSLGRFFMGASLVWEASKVHFALDVEDVQHLCGHRRGQAGDRWTISDRAVVLQQGSHMCIRSGGWLSCGPEVRLRVARRCWGKASVCTRVKKVRRVASCCTFPKKREWPMHFN